MIVELEILYFNDEQIIIQDSGKDVPLKDCAVRKQYFVNIDWFAPRSDDARYTMISSGNEEFTSNESVENIKLKIQQASLFKLN